jgi:virginiamycin A acetyltransferase
MNNSSYISQDAKIVDSIIGENAKLYRYADIRKSKLGDFVQIGDDSIIIESDLAGNNAINRRNFIQQSQIGKFSYTGFNTIIRGVKIGNFCSISWNVSIGGKDHNIENVTSSAIWGFYNMLGEKMPGVFEYGKDKSHCLLENDVLISSNAVILRNVKIGNGAVVGAGSVVTKDVEPYSIVAGVPAKKINMRFEDKTIEALEKIKWWNWPTNIIRENLELIYSTKVDEYVIEKLYEIANNLKT